ncbi:hypothetical protein FSARC_1818 [Fusarium sarcochroum]|uniref:Uncharacterized protein n=1 Tax=Fusarium sarcochroum TaxID=1208366 RepID=A0A8H4XEL2_9HYPO|nr:hypothetical protein FSARC_1818 [Fusarium sarcochroum]
MSSPNSNDTPHERTRLPSAPVSRQGEPSMPPATSPPATSSMPSTPRPATSSMPVPILPATSSVPGPPLVVSSTPSRPKTFSMLPPPAIIMHPPWCPRGHPAGIIHTSFNPQDPIRHDYPPLDLRVNAFWQQNVGRVLGPQCVGTWPDVESMVNEFETIFRQQQGSVAILGRQWNLRELEICARLRAWRLPEWALVFWLGSPSTVPGPDLLRQFSAWAHDEMRRMEQVNGIL